MPSFSQPKPVERARPLLGTLVSIRASGLAEAQAHNVINQGFAEIATLHRLMSFHEPESDVSRLNRDAIDFPVQVDPRTIEVLRAAHRFSAESDGVFDITVAAQLVDWTLLPPPSSRYAPDPSATWRDIEFIGADAVRFLRPLWIDLGGIAKGYAVDRAIHLLQSTAPAQYLVNAGGDLRVAGPGSVRVQLAVPGFQGNAAPGLDVEDGSVASSSGRAHARRRDGATISAHVHGTSREAVGVRRFVSVVAPRCVTADALTKIVLARGVRAGSILRRFGATAYLHSASGGGRILGT